MKRIGLIFMAVATLLTPAAARAGTASCFFGASLNPFAAVAVPTVTVCANNQLFTFSDFTTNGKIVSLSTRTINLGNGISFTVGASFNSDPFSNFTFGSVLPSGFGAFTFDAFFSTPVIPGAYNNAASSGTIGITTTGSGVTTGTVSAGTDPFYFSGLRDNTSLGVGTGTGACAVSTPPSPASTSCNPSGASNNFAPVSPAFLTAHLSYKHTTVGSGSSTTAFTGGVTLNTVTTTAPEPATLGLVFAGLVVLGATRLRRSRG